MITASHNPKDDNGYKLYWENGCQIIPPHDSLISNSIMKPENLIPWGPEVWNYFAVEDMNAIREGLIELPMKVVFEAYFERIAASSLFR